MDLPTYTNIWRIEKRLYKLYDLKLPTPLPIVWIGVFVGVAVPWWLFLRIVGLPFDAPWHVVYLVPPGIVTWLSTRPVIEGKRLTELIQSQVRYLAEPRTWCRMAPVDEPDEVSLTVRVWRSSPARRGRSAGRQRRAAAPTVQPAVAQAAKGAAAVPAVAEPLPAPPPMPLPLPGAATGAASASGTASAATQKASRPASGRRGRADTGTGPAKAAGGSSGSGARGSGGSRGSRGSQGPAGSAPGSTLLRKDRASARGSSGTDPGYGETVPPAPPIGPDALRKLRRLAASAQDGAGERRVPERPVLQPGLPAPGTPARDDERGAVPGGEDAPRLPQKVWSSPETPGATSVESSVGTPEAAPGSSVGTPEVTARESSPESSASAPGSSVGTPVAAPGESSAETSEAMSVESSTGMSPAMSVESGMGGSAVYGGVSRLGAEAVEEAIPETTDAAGADAPVGMAGADSGTAGPTEAGHAERRGHERPRHARADVTPEEEREITHDRPRHARPDMAPEEAGEPAYEPMTHADAEPASGEVSGDADVAPRAGTVAERSSGRVDEAHPVVEPSAQGRVRPEERRLRPVREPVAETSGDDGTARGHDTIREGGTAWGEVTAEGEATRQGGTAWGHGTADEGGTAWGQVTAGEHETTGRSGSTRQGGTAWGHGTAEERGITGEGAAAREHGTGREDGTPEPGTAGDLGTGGEAGTAEAVGTAGGQVAAGETVHESVDAPAVPVSIRTAAPGDEPRVRRVESVVGRDTSGGWRRIAQVVVGGGGGRTDGMEIDEARARTVLTGSRRILVLGCTGGAGQTTTTLMLGHTFAKYRDDRVVALDASTGEHTLTTRIAAESPETLSSLLAGSGGVSGYLGMRAYTSRCDSGLEVVGADSEAGAAQRLESGWPRMLAALDRHYRLIVVDPAAALAARLLPYADQLVLVAPASEDAPDAVAMTYEWLDGHGCSDLRRRAVMVVNGVSRRSASDVEQAEAVARGRCRAIVRIPWEDELSRLGPVDPARLRPGGRRAYVALAGVIASGLAANQHKQEVAR
ncbi:conjugal transfer protein [Microtetraspora niveoalba]|uniref:conjugal transfer protein n=1 Tax=Microtetraspora niveoalba TaxID=46175 RepID=UPI000831C5C4|nr:conjugal transfer protein [Microtetraspora niveoalba]